MILMFCKLGENSYKRLKKGKSMWADVIRVDDAERRRNVLGLVVR